MRTLNIHRGSVYWEYNGHNKEMTTLGINISAYYIQLHPITIRPEVYHWGNQDIVSAEITLNSLNCILNVGVLEMLCIVNKFVVNLILTAFASI